MSQTPDILRASLPLQLDFFQPGRLDRKDVNGVIHRKTMPYSILLQVQEGHYTVECRGLRFNLFPGRTALIPADTEVELTHHAGKRGIMRTHWVHFRFNYHGLLDFLSFYTTPLRLPAHASKPLRSLIQRALKLEESALPSPQRHVAEYTLASHILEIVLQTSKWNGDAWESPGKQRFHPLLRYIHDHLNKPLTVRDMARQAGLSGSRFHTLFRSQFGYSPMGYVSKIRLEAAARLLAGSDAKLAHIAESCGFADAFHLSHAFKRHYGIPPKQYRKHASL